MTEINLNSHISKTFDEELERLKSQLLDMGSLVESQLANAVKALTTSDDDLAKQVLKDEQEVDCREISLDDACMRVIATRQPAASDLRLILMVSKITRDLERMGDEAHKIASLALELNKESDGKKYSHSDVRYLHSGVQKMLSRVLAAFDSFDVDTAFEVLQADLDIDNQYESALRALMTYMIEDPRTIGRVMNVTWALRAIERIGDHACNIAEHIIYVVKGFDVRHLSLEEAKAQIIQRR